MKKIIFVLFFIVVVNSYPQNRGGYELVDEDPRWDRIVDKEWMAHKGFAGEGILFKDGYNEAGKVKVCTYMVYGSGNPVVVAINCRVELKGDEVIIHFPEGSRRIYGETLRLKMENDGLHYEDYIFRKREITLIEK